jgi:nucleotide-binding universal stress UspA family protein
MAPGAASTDHVSVTPDFRGETMGTLVCAVDNSPEAEEALRVATRLSREADLRLVVVHVEDTVGAGSDVRGAAGERGRKILDRLLATQGLNGGADRRVEVGAPAQELARVAAEEAASLILVGSRRRRCWRSNGTSRLAADLSATAACPVVVVPPAAPH